MIGGRRAVVAIVAGVVVVLAASGLVSDRLVPESPHAVVVDPAGMAVVRERLGPVATDLSAVASPAHTRPAPPAELVGCSVDSGELFGPSVHREWELKQNARSSDPDGPTASAGGRAAASSIARSLLARGWVGHADLDRDGVTGLRGPHGHTWVTVQVLGDHVLATGLTSHRRVCGLSED